MDKITIRAMAKINLGLDVLGRRDNGYHEVKMIMQTIDLYDTLIFEKKREEGIVIEANHPMVPCDESNLVYQAASLLMKKHKIDSGLKITLEKRIPVAAGMAGGSTDAAAALVGVNRLFDLQISTEELKEIGVTIGADVPYCIDGGTALSEGIGEILSPLPTPAPCYVVIAKPDLSVSTAYVYGNLNLKEIVHPDIEGMIEAIKNQNLQQMCAKMGNVLETVTEKKHPVITELKKLMKENGAVNSMMSGSGPTVFGIFDSLQRAKNAAQEVEKTGFCEQIAVTVFARKAQVVEE